MAKLKLFRVPADILVWSEDATSAQEKVQLLNGAEAGITLTRIGFRNMTFITDFPEITAVEVKREHRE